MKFFRILLSVLFLQLLLSCKKDKEPLNLFYTINYKNDSWEKHRTGLLWTLSYLGASLPEGSLDKSISWRDSNTFNLNIEKLGFSESALKNLQVIIDSIQKSNYYKKFGKADLGLFISLTLGSSWHYYKITGVAETLEEFQKKHNSKNFKIFPVTNSTVAKHQRIIKYSFPPDDPMRWMFVAEEGNGKMSDGTFTADFFEVFDIMPNGQLRFAIYNKQGKLVEASPVHYGQAGKPAKCIWCHEIVIQPLFTRNDSTSGFISPRIFQQDMLAFMNVLTAYRNKLKSDLDFTKTQDHTQLEIEYISFMQPSVNKLMKEWNMSSEEVLEITKRLQAGAHEEFKFLGNLFKRAEVNRFGDIFPESIREPNKHEINFFEQ